MPKIQFRSNPIAKFIYNQDIGDLLYLANNNNSSTNNKNLFLTKFAEMGRNGSFKNKKVFEGLCYIMVQIADHRQYKKGLQNFKYSDQFSDFVVILASLIQVKRLANTIKYTGPIIALSDNTKIKERLGFFSLFGCVVGSTLLTELTRVSTYKDIYQIVDMIKSHNAIASQVHVYLLQVNITISEGDDFSEGCLQLALILDSTQQSRNLSIEIDVDVDIRVVNRMLKVFELVNQRCRHEAYTSQRMERRVAGFFTSAPNNRYSSLV
ncbi:13865_t:CDS:2 [Gigaspora margarita]|uniref:13865_t:CDS:1 n=1 Tax=Gigaspora margarita TaxID=4874 RepID=A0ABN7VV48_GIGMA|nr:13865_t:CDS:2 [Gigaspora margarita]